jgi:hypothetical protein
MNPELIITAVGGVLSLINTILPMIHKGTAGTDKISTVIDTLTKVAPLITDQIGTVYTGVKNVIASIGAHPATSADQMAALRAFDKQVDDAWDAIESQLDPDASEG